MNSSVGASENIERRVIWLCACAVGIWQELELEERLRAYGEEQGMTYKVVCVWSFKSWEAIAEFQEWEGHGQICVIRRDRSGQQMANALERENAGDEDERAKMTSHPQRNDRAGAAMGPAAHSRGYFFASIRIPVALILSFAFFSLCPAQKYD